YGYIKNHKKTVKNGQTRTRESEEHKRSQGFKAEAKKSQLWSIKYMGICRFAPDVTSKERMEDVYLGYGYIKNHKKTVKNGQARTRERKSVQKPEAKP
ncbi:hypothetical protein Tco_0712723, partial [Tanacetum coccineum]